MKTLMITQLKPNPAGKDRQPFGPIDPSQLAAEWVDIKNMGATGVNTRGVEVNNKAFRPGDTEGHWRAVVALPDFVLPTGAVLRLHSGKGGDYGVIRAEDNAGSDYRMFTGRNDYVWNNREGDTAALWDLGAQQWIDGASYDPNPPEGVVLVRHGTKLEPAYAPAFRYR